MNGSCHLPRILWYGLCGLVDEIQFALPRPQDEDTRETKRPRLEEPVHISIDEAATNTTSHDTVVAFPAAAQLRYKNTAARIGLQSPCWFRVGRAFRCQSRWHNVLYSSVDGVNKCTGKRKEDEDIKLKAAVQKHGDKDWAAIVSLVQGRTRKQCWNRWKRHMDPLTA
jgi:hypothetical protein